MIFWLPFSLVNPVKRVQKRGGGPRTTKTKDPRVSLEIHYAVFWKTLGARAVNVFRGIWVSGRGDIRKK